MPLALLAACGGGDSPLGPGDGGDGGDGGGGNTPLPFSVQVSPAVDSVGLGETVQLTATVRDAQGNAMSGQTVTWSSTATNIAQVSATGLVTGMALGGAQIRATAGGKTGTASITVKTDPCSTARTIALGQTSGSTLGPGDCQASDGSYAEIWTLTLADTRSIAIDLATGTQFDAYLLLYDAAGQLLQRDDDTGEGLDARIVTTLPAGTYRIVVNTYASGDGGSYNLSVTETTDPCAQAVAINVGQTRSGALAETDCRLPTNQNADIWRVSLSAQTALRITLTSPAFNAYLILVNANGQVVAEDDDGSDGTNARITVTVPAGTYYIYATSYYEGQTGSYTLAVASQ
jgi:serine protease Do